MAGPSIGAGTQRGSRAVRCAQDPQGQPQVRDATGHGARDHRRLDRDGLDGGLGAGALGDAPARRLDRGDPAHLRRDPQRAAKVVAQAQRRHPRRQGNRLAARRAARRAGRVPRVAGVAGAAALGVPPEGEVGQVGAGEGDGAGLAQAGDRRRVGRGDLPRERGNTPGRGRARDVDVLLDGERHAGKRPQRPACSHRAVDRGCRRARLVGQRHGDRIDVLVHLGDPRKVGLDHLGRRHLACGDHPRQLSGTLGQQLVHGALLLSGRSVPVSLLGRVHPTSGGHPISADPLRLGELVATLALAQDNAFGQPFDSQLRSCLLAMALCDEAGFDEELRRTVYWVSLLRYVGCTGHAHEVASVFGDDIAILGQTLVMDAADPADVGRTMVAAATAGPPARRAPGDHQGAPGRRPRLGRPQLRDRLRGGRHAHPAAGPGTGRAGRVRVHLRALERQRLPDARERRPDPAGDARRPPHPRHGGDQPPVLACRGDRRRARPPRPDLRSGARGPVRRPWQPLARAR